MRQLAWLHAAPETKKGGSRGEPRIKQYTDSIPLPDIEDGGYLINLLTEFGPSMPSMNGPAPVNFQEIVAWLLATKTELHHWEVLLLRQLSEAYCSQYHKSAKWNEPAPYFKQEALPAKERDEVIKNLFRARFNKEK